ncbi:MAG: endonuclease/exonuclease/phosphatase family protein [Candidatus Marinimicrobia bacterium]|nr:endonuclease/exonuclease/phosphatase family protein [Candidatus Neomarinimicrobiota bacterium]
MKKLLILLFPLIFWVCAEKSPYTPSITQTTIDDIQFGLSGTFEVATWNIEFFPKQFNTTVENVRRVMLAIDAEVYALQEISNRSYFYQLIDEINEADTVETWVGFRAGGSSTWGELAYIIKTSVVEIVQEPYERFTSEWSAFPRAPYILEVSYEGEEIIVINNHLKCCGNGTIDYGNNNDEEYRRLRAIQLLYDYINDVFQDKNVIVVGDFNDELQDNPENNIFWEFIDDPAQFQFTDMGIAQDPTQRSWSYPLWPSHLDHILINDELFDEFLLTGSQIKTIRIDDYMDGGFSEYDMTTSDHRPVGIRLQFD